MMLPRQVDGALEGVVRVKGTMVGKWRGKGAYWSIKATRVVLAALEGGTNTLQVCHILKKTIYVMTS